jgi:hypothetical protein
LIALFFYLAFNSSLSDFLKQRKFFDNILVSLVMAKSKKKKAMPIPSTVETQQSFNTGEETPETHRPTVS